MARRKLASARQILRAGFRHCADFRNCCFILPGLSVRSSSTKLRAEHHCPARLGRDNLFRGLLFCDCCGHPLTLSRKKPKNREVDIYFCNHHNRHRDGCPKTYISCHEITSSNVLKQIKALRVLSGRLGQSVVVY